MRRLAPLILVSFALLPLAGCDALTGALGIESSEKVAAARDAEGKAIGGACRHAGRAIEDCYVLNKTSDKAAVFGGWRDMNDYMRENKIEATPPQFTPVTASQLAAVQAQAASAASEAKLAAEANGDAPAGRTRDAAKPRASKARDS